MPAPVTAGDFAFSCRICVLCALCLVAWGDEQGWAPPHTPQSTREGAIASPLALGQTLQQLFLGWWDLLRARTKEDKSIVWMQDCFQMVLVNSKVHQNSFFKQSRFNVYNGLISGTSNMRWHGLLRKESAAWAPVLTLPRFWGPGQILSLGSLVYKILPVPFSASLQRGWALLCFSKLLKKTDSIRKIPVMVTFHFCLLQPLTLLWFWLDDASGELFPPLFPLKLRADKSEAFPLGTECRPPPFSSLSTHCLYEGKGKLFCSVSSPTEWPLAPGDLFNLN